MAFQMSYTSADGASHPESYWRPELMDVRRSGRLATAVFRGWHNAATAQIVNGLPTNDPIAAADHRYDVVGDAFDQMRATLNAEGAPSTEEYIYQLARQTADTPDPNQPGGWISFFANATDV
jgi:hypothetical protein